VSKLFVYVRVSHEVKFDELPVVEHPELSRVPEAPEEPPELFKTEPSVEPYKGNDTGWWPPEEGTMEDALEEKGGVLWLALSDDDSDEENVLDGRDDE
jgi:hypothetical protein